MNFVRHFFSQSYAANIILFLRNANNETIIIACVTVVEIVKQTERCPHRKLVLNFHRFLTFVQKPVVDRYLLFMCMFFACSLVMFVSAASVILYLETRKMRLPIVFLTKY